MGTARFMDSPIGFPKTISWLLAAALVVQPMSGFSCGCSATGADVARRPAKQRCCCCCGSVDRGEMSNRPQRTCCQHRPDRDTSAPRACACHCRSALRRRRCRPQPNVAILTTWWVPCCAPTQSRLMRPRSIGKTGPSAFRLNSLPRRNTASRSVDCVSDSLTLEGHCAPVVCSQRILSCGPRPHVIRCEGDRFCRSALPAVPAVAQTASRYASPSFLCVERKTLAKEK